MLRICIVCLFLMTLTSSALSNNYELTKEYLEGNIAFIEVISNLDTSRLGVENFIDQSIRNNIGKDAQLNYAHVEFFVLIDSIVVEFLKDNSLLYLFEVFDDVVDGWVATEYAGIIRRSCDRYPEQFKRAIIEQGKHSSILNDYLVDAGMNYKESIFFNQKSQYNQTIFEWTDFQKGLEAKHQGCINRN